jgi:hypothetical protein
MLVREEAGRKSAKERRDTNTQQNPADQFSSIKNDITGGLARAEQQPDDKACHT